MNLIDEAGIKAGLFIAGIIGGMVSLSFLRSVTPLNAFLTIATGAMTAAYLTPLICEWFELSKSAENALAFFIGVCGMNIVAGIHKLSEMFSNKPIETLKKMRGK